MDKSRLKAYGPFAFFWLIDYFIKSFFVENYQQYQFSFIHFSYHENHGIIMGSFNQLPLILKTVFLCTTGVAIVTSLPVLLSLIHFRLNKTVIGLSLVFSGIIGNVTDRIVYGYVVDYIYFKTPFFTTPVFNLADAIQWIGYTLLCVGLYHELSHHFPEDDKRHNGWINRSYQLRFTFSLLAVVLGFSLTFVAFGFTFLKYSLIEMNLTSDEITRYLKFYSLTAGAILFFSSILILLIGKIISHRIAGPAFAIKRYLKDTMLGKKYPFKLRDHDHLKELEEPLTEMNDRLAKKIELKLIEEEDEIPEIPEEAKISA